MISAAEQEPGAAGLTCEICGDFCLQQRLSPHSMLLRCRRCGHVIRDLRLCPANAREKSYGGSEKFDRFRLFFTRRRLLRLLRDLPGDRPLNVLEVGFGGGHLLQRFQMLGHRVWGVEVCPQGGPAMESIISHGGRLFFTGLDQASLPAAAMDLVYLVHVAEHLPDPGAGFRTLAAAARPGALLYLITPNGRSAGLQIFGDRWWHLEDPTHQRFFTSDSIRHSLQDAGFRVLRIRAPVADSLSLEVNSLLRFFFCRGAVMDRALTRWLDVLMMPIAVLARWFWPRLRPNIEVLARRTGDAPGRGR